MNHFTAKDAKMLVQSSRNDELNDVLFSVKSRAENGETVLHIYKQLNTKTLNALREKGFNVSSHSSIAIQRDDLYYSIYWD